MGELDYAFRPYVQTITFRDDGLAEWKQYRRSGRLFWRKYGREVRGGVTLVQRIGFAEAAARRWYEDHLCEQLFGVL